MLQLMYSLSSSVCKQMIQEDIAAYGKKESVKPSMLDLFCSCSSFQPLCADAGCR